MPNLPALTVGLILIAYWARVIRLVRKIRRQTGRSANPLPPELLGRLLRIVWYPVVGGWIILPLLAAFSGPSSGLYLPRWCRPMAHPAAVDWIALAVAIAALAGTLVCWKKMGKSWRMGIDPDDKSQLIVSGPYARVRHPIYALSSVLMLATLAIAPSWAMLAIAGVHLLLLQWEARREEKYLLMQHGPVYATYYRQTGRFFPALRKSAG